MIFENFDLNDVAFLLYGDKDNGFSVTKVENSDNMFTLKFIKNKEVKMMIIKRNGLNDYKVIITDKFDPEDTEQQMLDFAKKEIEFYLIKQKPVVLELK